MQEESKPPPSTSGVLSGDVTAGGTFDDMIADDEADEELDDFDQYCEDFLENDDPSLFPQDEDGWMVQS